VKPPIGGLRVDALGTCPLGQIHLSSIALERTYAVYRALIWQQFRTPQTAAPRAASREPPCATEPLLPGHPQGPLRHRPSLSGGEKDEAAADDERHEQLSRCKLCGRSAQARRRRPPRHVANGARHAPLPPRGTSISFGLEHPKVCCPPAHRPTSAPRSPSPSREASTKRPSRATTTSERPGAAPMPGDLWSRQTPGSRTPSPSSSPGGSAR
jgi:hypothetical protein